MPNQMHHDRHPEDPTEDPRKLSREEIEVEDEGVEEIVKELEQHEETERVRGYVLEYDEIRQAGLIDADDETEEIFVHIDDLQTDAPEPVLEEGERLEFRVEETEKGLQARDVRRVE